MKLFIHLVTWNGSKYIPYLFESLRNQTFKNFKLIILDNASTDDTVEKIKHELQNFSFAYELIINKENKGFAGGHNQLFEIKDQKSKIKNDYVLLLNQDMYLMSDCLEKMVKFMDENKEIAGVSPRLMRWDCSGLWTKDYELNKSFTDLVDSLGLKIFRNRRVIEQYTQKNWTEIKNNFSNNILETFGLSGAFPMFRQLTISKILLQGKIFDESYHSYKEDVDLAFRMLSHGLVSRVLLDVVAYHDRAGAGPKEMDDKSAWKSKQKQSDWVKYHSYKNHLMTLYKNEYWQNFLLDFFPILWYELKKFGYFLLFDRSVLKGLKEVWQMRKDLKNKRKEIIKKRKISWKEIRQWWK
ncbi:MAG: glycosyltransferase [Patescibacteria group bacterium]|jgi:GT2 family glycosyltransferase|nr:glycosyltransferase family 2 protein [Candidatus Magasanikbacteria bacterium]